MWWIWILIGILLFFVAMYLIFKPTAHTQDEFTVEQQEALEELIDTWNTLTTEQKIEWFHKMGLSEEADILLQEIFTEDKTED